MILQCDETRPECTRCQKAGRQCPGYRKEMILRHYNAGGLRTNTFKSSPKRVDLTVRQDSSSLSSGSGLLLSHITDKLSFVSPSLSSIFTNQAVSTLIVSISPEWQILPPSQRYTRIWLQEVVRRAETDTLLTYATRALSLLCLGRTTGAQDMITAAQTIYTSALKRMHCVISGGIRAFANIQSAAMLLTYFEVGD